MNQNNQVFIFIIFRRGIFFNVTEIYTIEQNCVIANFNFISDFDSPV